jgi:hypothetical protein
MVPIISEIIYPQCRMVGPTGEYILVVESQSVCMTMHLNLSALPSHYIESRFLHLLPQYSHAFNPAQRNIHHHELTLTVDDDNLY